MRRNFVQINFVKMKQLIIYVILVNAVPVQYTLYYSLLFNNKHWYWHCFYLFPLVLKNNSTNINHSNETVIY